MRKILLSAAILCLVVSSPAQQAPPDPRQSRPPDVQPDSNREEIANLLGECNERTISMLKRLFDYAYTASDVTYDFDRTGRVSRGHSRVFESYPARGAGAVIVNLSRDGKPLGAEKIERERRQASRELGDADKDYRRNNQPDVLPRLKDFGFTIGCYRGDEECVRLSLLALPRTHEVSPPRRASHNGRESLVVNFRPRSDAAAAADVVGRVRARLGGRIWIDASDHVLVRWEIHPSEELEAAGTFDDTTPDQTAVHVYEAVRLEDGTWVPALHSVDTSARAVVFEGLRRKWSRKYGDYRSFKTIIEDARTEPPRP